MTYIAKETVIPILQQARSNLREMIVTFDKLSALELIARSKAIQIELQKASSLLFNYHITICIPHLMKEGDWEKTAEEILITYDRKARWHIV